MNSNKKARRGGGCRRTTQLRKDEKQTLKMTEVQSSVQRKGKQNYKGKICKEERNYLYAPVIKKVEYWTKSTEHRTSSIGCKLISRNIKICDGKKGHRKRPRAVMWLPHNGYHSNDLNRPPRSTVMGRRIYNSH